MCDVVGKLVENVFELSGWVEAVFSECMHHAHQGASGFGSGIGLGAEADFAGDDGGSQVALGEVVLGGNASVVGPAVKASFVVLEDALYVANGAMLGGSGNGGENLLFESGGFAVELFVGDGLAAQVHGQR